MRQAGRLRALREPNFRRLFLGRTVSMVGDGLAPVALAFAVLDLTGSVSDLGIVLAARSLTTIALLLVGGVFADRISPRLAMLRADAARTLAVGAIAALLIAGVAQVWELALLYAIEGAATAFFNPASNAIVPQIVAAPGLQEANALLSLSRSAGKFAGPALAGVLLALGSPGWALAFDALTFAVSAAFLLRLRAPGRPPTRAEAPSFLAELREGWAEFSSRTWLWVIVLSAAVGNAVFSPVIQVLGPAVARESLGGSTAWAAIAAALGLGMLAGGAIAISTKPRRPLLVGEGGLVIFGLPALLLALPAATVVIAAGMFAVGVALSLAEILYDTATGQHVPPRSFSRVMAYDWLGSLALAPVGLALVGPISGALGLSTTLVAAGVLLTICQTAVMAVPSVRRLQARPQAEPTPLPLSPLDAAE